MFILFSVFFIMRRYFLWGFVCLFFLLFRTAPAAYESFQSRGRIGPVATALLDLSHICNLCLRLPQCWNLNPLSRARDQTHILMDTSWVRNPLSHNGNSLLVFFKVGPQTIVYVEFAYFNTSLVKMCIVFYVHEYMLLTYLYKKGIAWNETHY